MYRSRIPAITAELEAKMDLVARGGAELVEQAAKARVPVATGALRDAIHVERERLGDYAVVAGNSDVFYGHIVEHGGVRTPVHPFMVPAAEESRGEIVAMGIAALRGL